MPALSTPTQALTLTFSPRDLSRLEAFASLHGTSVAAFIQKAALEAANITSTKKSIRSSANDTGALWLTDGFAGAPESESEPDLLAPVDAPVVNAPVKAEAAPGASQPIAPAKKGVVGEQSQLAKGHGMVWEIRRALGRERVHSLGWTREQLAFVLKLSVVGVRKMEHLGTTPIKSMEARKKLLGLAKTLENPSTEICAYIAAEESVLAP